MMDYLIRPYQPRDEFEILELLKQTFPRWAGLNDPMNNWKWRYLDDPLGSEIVVAEYDGHVVGVEHCARVYIKLGERSVLSHLVGNTVIDRNHRGTGLYRKIVNFLVDSRRENNIDFAIWSSSNPIIIGSDSKYGFHKFPPTISFMVNIRSIEEHLTKKRSTNPLSKKYGYKLMRNLMKIKNKIDMNESNQIKGFDIVDTQKFGKEIDEFWEMNRVNYTYALERNSSYLNWRYTDPRSGNFLIKLAVEEDRILGYIIAEMKNEGGYTESYISDLLTLPNRSDVAHALMKDISDNLEGSKVNTINFYVARNHPNYKIAGKNGFVDSRHKLYYGISHSEDGGMYDILRSSPPNKIHFQFGDMDLY